MAAPLASSDSIESSNPNASQSPESEDSGTKKRSSSAAGLDKDGNPKPVKRRAAKACAACRARKVRCDVTQKYHVSPTGEATCSNCQMDSIPCVVEESKRRKKHLQNGQATEAPAPAPQGPIVAQTWTNGSGGVVVNPFDLNNSNSRRWSGSQVSNDPAPDSGHVPHAIYQNINQQIHMRRASYIPAPGPYDQDPNNIYSLLTSASMSGDRTATRIDSPVPPAPLLKHQLPGYLKPLPQRMTSVDIDYLYAKGALSLPATPIRNALLRSYYEYVHPYMPLIEAFETFEIIDDGTGRCGQLSLLLFQAIMFAGTAFVDMSMLKAAGFNSRKEARKAFFQKARVLYDFDYELDRISLVQSLLLMTYWYETPDDQKDTWHWMGVAISLAHTIGLHRNPEESRMEERKIKLWKRIWWSCFMRDRLVALGMRRPTRVKDEDYDVPMLTENDFEIGVLPTSNSIIPNSDSLARDVAAQRQLAQMCIAKAKLSVCISHVLTAQYSVLVKHQGMQSREGTTRSSVMLFPKKIDQTEEVKRCDEELTTWIDELPEALMYSPETPNNNSGSPLSVQRSLLHMIYFTTLSALHRPQVLPSGPPGKDDSEEPGSTQEVQDLSRKRVCEASREITRIAHDLHTRDLEKYLPTTGVTVLLPAIIIHLLNIKSCNDEARKEAMAGFCKCMTVLEILRDNYASADFAVSFLDAAIKKAEIDVKDMPYSRERTRQQEFPESVVKARANRRTPPPSNEVTPSITEEFDMANREQYSKPETDNAVLTPAESDDPSSAEQEREKPDFEMPSAALNGNNSNNNNTKEVDDIMQEFFNYPDTGNEMWNMPLEEGAHGESGGFMGDMDWLEHSMWSSRPPSPEPGDEIGMFGSRMRSLLD